MPPPWHDTHPIWPKPAGTWTIRGAPPAEWAPADCADDADDPQHWCSTPPAIRGAWCQAPEAKSYQDWDDGGRVSMSGTRWDETHPIWPKPAGTWTIRGALPLAWADAACLEGSQHWCPPAPVFNVWQITPEAKTCLWKDAGANAQYGRVPE